MKLSKSEYDELIRKRPGLKPTEVIKAHNTHKAMQKMLDSGLDNVFAEGHSILLEQSEAAGRLLETRGLLGPIAPKKPVKSPRTLKFTIPGQPVGKPRMTQQDKWRKRPIVMKYWAWADKARAAVPKGVELAVYRQISFVAYLEFPKSYSTTKRAWLTGQPHFEKPDGDNVLKAILDSLFPEDKCIWKFSGEKLWEDGAGARIEVELR